MGLFERIEDSAVAVWVGESLWGYPFLLSLHVVGLAILVGTFVMLDLRLLGRFEQIRVVSFLPAIKFAWSGFFVNAVSGALLFSSQASHFVTSTPFLLKISMIFVGAVLALMIQRQLKGASDSNWTISGSTKAIAALSLAMWLGAIINGRLIAYF